MTEPRPVSEFATELANLLLTARQVLDPQDFLTLLGHAAGLVAELYAERLETAP